MKRTISPILYRSEEMNLDLVEQAVQNIVNRGFGAASPAVTPFTLFKYIAREYAKLEDKLDIVNYVKIKAYAWQKTSIIYYFPKNSIFASQKQKGLKAI